MPPCPHKQQFVAPLFRGLTGQHCQQCGELMDAWKTKSGDSVSKEMLYSLKKLTMPKYDDDLEN